MQIEFDAAKDAENVRKHGISLTMAREFISFARVEDKRFAYNEIRERAYGYIGDQAYCLVFTLRGTNVRAISLRRAHAKEMRKYVPQKK